MKREQRGKKQAYLDDYHKNSEGKYEYQGKRYSYSGGAQEFARKKRLLWGIYILLMSCAAASGCIPAKELNSTFYIVLPCACGIIGAVTLGWALVRLSSAGNTLKKYIYEATVKKLPHRAMVTMIMEIAALLGVLAYIILNGIPKDWVYFLIFALLCLVSGVLAVIFYRAAARLSWQEVCSPKNKELHT